MNKSKIIYYWEASQWASMITLLVAHIFWGIKILPHKGEIAFFSVIIVLSIILQSFYFLYGSIELEKKQLTQNLGDKRFKEMVIRILVFVIPNLIYLGYGIWLDINGKGIDSVCIMLSFMLIAPPFFYWIWHKLILKINNDKFKGKELSESFVYSDISITAGSVLTMASLFLGLMTKNYIYTGFVAAFGLLVIIATLVISILNIKLIPNGNEKA